MEEQFGAFGGMQEEEAGAAEWCPSGTDGDKPPLCPLSTSTSNRFQALADKEEVGIDTALPSPLHGCRFPRVTPVGFGADS